LIEMFDLKVDHKDLVGSNVSTCLSLTTKAQQAWPRQDNLGT